MKYIIDPYKIKKLEVYSKMWIRLVNKLGGTHQGYFLPYEGANNIAFPLFTFPSLTAHEAYRVKTTIGTECLDAFRYAEETKCILSYEKSFMRPVFE